MNTGTQVIDMKNEKDRQMLQAITIKAHLKLMKLGLKNSRMTGRDMLNAATKITGKTYKRGQYELAYDDLKVFVDAGLV